MLLFSSCVACINYLLEIENSGLVVKHFGKTTDRVSGLAFFFSMEEGLQHGKRPRNSLAWSIGFPKGLLL